MVSQIVSMPLSPRSCSLISLIRFGRFRKRSNWRTAIADPTKSNHSTDSFRIPLLSNILLPPVPHSIVYGTPHRTAPLAAGLETTRKDRSMNPISFLHQIIFCFVAVLGVLQRNAEIRALVACDLAYGCCTIRLACLLTCLLTVLRKLWF